MTDAEVMVFVEIPAGSRNKYEWDPEVGGIVLDRRLFTSMSYPADYGFIEGTLGGDGDPLDALVMVGDPTFPGCRIRVRVIGVFYMEDEKGSDEKVICVSERDPAWMHAHDIHDLFPEFRAEIEQFFQVYKQLEQKKIATRGFGEPSGGARRDRCRPRASGRRRSADRLAAGRQADGAADAGTANPAVPIRVLGQVLLVVLLGVVERTRFADLGRDVAVSGCAQARLEHRA